MDSTIEAVMEQEVSLNMAIRNRIARVPFPTPSNLLAVAKKAHSEASPELARKVLYSVARDLEDELAHTIERGRHVGPLLQMSDQERAAEERAIAIVRAAAASI